LISGKLDRRRRALFWSTIASAAIHLIVLTLLFYAVVRLLIPRGSRETVSQTRTVTITKAAVPTPASTPAAPRHVRVVRQHQSAPATIPRHEIVRETAAPAPPAPHVHHVVVPSKLERDEAGFAREVAQLNEQNNPHAIPTIDPAARESSSKTYAFQIPASAHGDEHGNGFIFPTRSWHDNGRDCYYGRYEFTYPDGANESGDIVWPFCFDPSADPFKEPPHPIPFPLPLVGFRLSSDAELPPIEKQVYDEWAAGNAGTSVPK
jgi:hypothetical protein